VTDLHSQRILLMHGSCGDGKVIYMLMVML